MDTIHPWVAEGAGKLRFGVQTSLTTDWSVTREFSQAAEDLGFDSLWIADHPLMGCDAWTTLAAISTVTRRIRLGTLVSCASYKNPVVLARQVADVDTISGGRSILGVGSGDIAWEFKHQGLEWGTFADRHSALVDTLEVVPKLLRGETVTYEGKRFRASGAALSAAAQQKPRVPILIAGGGEKTTLPCVVRYADACNIGAASWAGSAFTQSQINQKFEVLRLECQEAGREYESVLRTAAVGFYLSETDEEAQRKRNAVQSDPTGRWMLAFLEQVPLFCTPMQAAEHLKGLAAAGCQYFIVIASPLDVKALELLASQVIPAVVAGDPGRLPSHQIT